VGTEPVLSSLCLCTRFITPSKTGFAPIIMNNALQPFIQEYAQ
jgi:hypothetical protein